MIFIKHFPLLPGTSLVLILDRDFVVNTLLVGKPEKGRMVENMLISMAQRGQIMGKMDEDELIGILEKISEQTNRQTKVKVSNAL